MEFKKYNSIENSYQDKFINTIINHAYDSHEYIVQEKVHGANLSFITDGKMISMAKRTEIITEDEDFYNSKKVLENYRNRILSLFNEVSKTFHTTTLTIFGEVFGGGYPHKDIPKNETAKLVQDGIYYCSHNEFFAFDILINNNHYINTDVTNSLFEKHKFIHAKTLFKGSFKDCLSYPNKFQTLLPAKFSLPEIEGNFCEGVIIRPVETLFLKNGRRVILKNKNEQWSENKNAIDKESLKILFQKEEALSKEAEFIIEEVLKLVTGNRLNNLISKIGEIDPRKDFGRLLGLYNKDVLTELLETHREQYELLEKQEIKSVNKILNNQSGKLINDYLKNILLK